MSSFYINELLHFLNNNELFHLFEVRNDEFHQDLNMSFWESVESELKYQNKTRKQLATEIGIDTTTISKGITNNSIPSADIALKIAYFLNVTLESLLGLPENGKNKKSADQQNQIRLYKKYFELINLAEKLNEQQLKSIENLMKTM